MQTLAKVLVVAVCALVAVSPAVARAARAAALDEQPKAKVWKVFQCRDAQGVRAYQDVPCARTAVDARTLQLSDYAPTLATAKRMKAAQLSEAKRFAAWERDSLSRLPPSLGGTARAAASPISHSGPRAPSRCDLARAARDTAYRERANAMTFNERRALLDHIDIACGAP